MGEEEMASTGKLVDLLLFYTLERLLFNRMVLSLSKNSKQVKEAIALLLMLEELGYHDLIRTINSYDNKTVDVLFDEALLCVECIKSNTSATPITVEDTPVFSGLLEEPMNLRFFHYNTQFMYKRYSHIMHSVCDKIFGEDKAIEVDESGTRAVIVKSPDWSNFPAAGSVVRKKDKDVTKKLKLNHDALEFHPKATPEDARTMFLTFSKGYPLSHEEIFQFFTSKWGRVVQEVLIEHTHEGVEPLFGRVVLTSSSVIPIILNGQAKAKFFVNHKHLWARTYTTHRSVKC
ncbi:hypothetical protein ACFE04_027483 [Oxalis oulophora]